jgi:hypothetical protein
LAVLLELLVACVSGKPDQAIRPGQWNWGQGLHGCQSMRGRWRAEGYGGSGGGVAGFHVVAEETVSWRCVVASADRGLQVASEDAVPSGLAWNQKRSLPRTSVLGFPVSPLREWPFFRKGEVVGGWRVFLQGAVDVRGGRPFL